jgi:hypothetical protein
MTAVKPKHDVYATVKVGASQETKALPQSLRSIEALAAADAAVTREVKFSFACCLKPGFDFQVNGGIHTYDKRVNVGKLQVWEVENTTVMGHPFHLHGFFFQVIEENGKATVYKAWKDTGNLKPKSKIT